MMPIKRKRNSHPSVLNIEPTPLFTFETYQSSMENSKNYTSDGFSTEPSMDNSNNHTTNGFSTPTKTIGKIITCKAAVAYNPGQPLVIEEIQVHPPQKMEVRIKILFTSICHTDLSAWKGESEAQRVFPRVLGHEASGVVESVGEGLTDMKPGDHVVPIFNGECGECNYCKSEATNLCDKFRVNPMKSVMENDGKTRFFTKSGEPIYHFLNTSTFSEFTVVDSACVVKIPHEAPLNKMTLLSCGVSTGTYLIGK
ncbi:hypothetical protein Leryth_005236 [Lithospermum erythrorhizon]|nr:hypothetical protein Leryth_005236 [Lithospermum erythrorhizon]